MTAGAGGRPGEVDLSSPKLLKAWERVSCGAYNYESTAAGQSCRALPFYLRAQQDHLHHQWVWAKVTAGHLWINAVSCIKENIWSRSGGKVVCLAPLLWSKSKEPTAPCDMTGAMTKGLPRPSSPSQGLRKNQRMDAIQMPEFGASFFSRALKLAICLFLAPCQQLGYVAMRRKDTGAWCLQASPWLPWLVLSTSALHPKGLCSSSVCRAGFRGFRPQCTAALSPSSRLAFFSRWARTFHWDHCS